MTLHFIGIGGIGMSGLAKIAILMGKKVSGSDIKGGPIIEDLRKLGANISLGHSKYNVKEGATVIYSSAVDIKNVELSVAKKMNLEIVHRSKFLARLMEGHRSIVVTGTHGKTTTTALLSQVLIDAGLDPTISVGGELLSIKSNARLGRGGYIVLEGDESDGSFLNYKPDIGVVTNIEREHIDYWKSLDGLKRGYLEFMKRSKRLFCCFEDPILKDMKRGSGYGFLSSLDFYACNIRGGGFFSIFDINHKGRVFRDIKLNLSGRHNILNALAVFSVALEIGIGEQSIRDTFSNFKGVKRRLEFLGEEGGVLFFDDYAHHPTEVKKTLKALREAARERRIISIFQPHRYSRLKDLFSDFSSAFLDADKIYITETYSAGESNEGISSKDLVESVRGAEYIKKEDIITIKDKLLPHDVIIFMGAGDITDIARKTFDIYKKGEKRKLKLALFFGGRSKEHKISKISCRNILKHLDRSIYDIALIYITEDNRWQMVDDSFKKIEEMDPFSLEKLKGIDIFFPVLHGTYGEDGMIQGFFETINRPYVGFGYKESALSMNKFWTKVVARELGAEVCDFLFLDRRAFERDSEGEVLKIEKKFSYPFFIKPNNLGSSIGVQKVEDREALERGIFEIFEMDDALLVEEEMKGKEIEFALLGDRFVEVAIPGEIVKDGYFYDFDKKYGKDASGVGATPTLVPADIPKEKIKEGMEIARMIYEKIGGSGFCRIDFFLREGKFYLNEINPIPGCTSTSLYPLMWERSGVSYKDWLDRLIVCAIGGKL